MAGLAPVVVLGLQNGGYDVDVVAGYTVLVWWWLVLGGVLGAAPWPRPTREGWVALGALAVLAGWGGLSLSWSASPERGLTEVVRVLAVAGTLGLGLSVTAAGHGRALVGGAYAGLVFLVAAAVVARFLPDLVPQAWEPGGVPTERLMWPLNYWNGLAAAAAIAIAAGPAIALRARTPLASGAALAALPVLIVGLSLTVSRGGIAAAGAGLLVALATVAPRLVLLRTILLGTVGGLALVAAVWARDAIPNAVGGDAGQTAGQAVLPLVLLVTLLVGMGQAGLRRLDERGRLPELPRPSRRTVLLGGGTAAVVVLVAALALGAAGEADRAWDRFKAPPAPVAETSPERLTAFDGSQRYQVWSGALDAGSASPLKGIGLGGWESWWSPRRGTNFSVRNAHSAPFELFAETGIVGAAALVVLVLAPLFGAVGLARRRRRPPHAVAAVPAVVAFAVAISVDWSWQLSVVPVAAFLLAAPLLGRSGRAPREQPARSERRRRLEAVGRPVLVGAAAVAVVWVCAIAYIAPTAVRGSREAEAAGRTDDAVAIARDGTREASFALSPAARWAAVLERNGRLAEAAAAARVATRREPENWRPWFVLARIEGLRGRTAAAVAAMSRAQDLNPSSPLVVAPRAPAGR